MIVARGRQISGRAWPLRAVGFAHPPPADDREHRRFFGCEVRFAEPEDSLAFDREFLDAPLPAADPALSSVLERYGDGLVARLPAGDPFLDDARRAVAALLRGGDTSLEALAARLGQSRRTLQRRLQALGTSQQDLVDSVRRELALLWLADPRTSITEVAYLLGFSEPTAFHRAFKRWTGTTPAEHRRARPSVPPSSR
jgi:AraC-like DNA-binding protein